MPYLAEVPFQRPLPLLLPDPLPLLERCQLSVQKKEEEVVGTA